MSSVLINASNDPEFRWDVVGLPNFEERLGIGREIDAHVLAISETSEHKEQAFQVIEVVTSDEVQTEMSKYGRIPILTDAEIISLFGSELPFFQGKNWDAMFRVKPGELRENPTPYDSLILRKINPLQERLRAGESDINTMLKQVQEEADQEIKPLMEGS